LTDFEFKYANRSDACVSFGANHYKQREEEYGYMTGGNNFVFNVYIEPVQ